METLSTDVLVIGGGAAGVAAATAARASGASVLLVERLGFLGGMATTAMVGTVCGLYLRSQSRQAVLVHRGFPRDFANELARRSQTVPLGWREGLQFLPYEAFAFRVLCDDTLQTAGAEVFLHTTVADMTMAGSTIEAVEVFAWDRRALIRPRAVVDCSGEAIAATLTKQAILAADEYQASAFVFSMVNVKTSGDLAFQLMTLRELKRAVYDGLLPAACEHVSVVPGSCRNNQLQFKIGITERVTDALNKVSLLERHARQVTNQIVAFLKDNVPEFRQAELAHAASQVGVRTGRRPIGKQTLTRDDVLTCKKFADGIANAPWPIEEWGSDGRPKLDYFKEDDYYQIPAGALQSAAVTNLFFAGRNISADAAAIASARVIGTCLATGYAAGKLAGFYTQERSADDAVAELRQEQTLEVGF